MSEPNNHDAAAVTSLDVRRTLVEAIELDLIGPWRGHELARERLPIFEAPSNWYLTGFLIPTGTPPELSRDDEQDDGGPDETPERPGLAEESTEGRMAAKKLFFPSSMGLSFLATADSRLDVSVRWGDYELVATATDAVEGDGGNDKAGAQYWQRSAREEAVEIAPQTAERPVHDVPGSGGLRLHVEQRPISEIASIPEGTRAVSVFLVNEREPATSLQDTEPTYAFQAEVEIRSEQPFVPRPDPRSAETDDWDEQVAALHYLDAPSYATGHNVGATWDVDSDGKCRKIRTTWMPRAEVEKTETSQPDGVDLSMDRLGQLAGADDADRTLRPLVAAYREWINEQRRALEEVPEEHAETAVELLDQAEFAASRMERGIATLQGDEQALDAFRLANRAVAQALRRRTPEVFEDAAPRWRAFQLAFILLNLAPLADPADPHREMVDLLFFPTGGGKTEAYLGLAAFAIVLRRLRNPEAGGRAGAGVSVVMRYTLRLLTLDQLSRAAGLICALELERADAPERYGEWPFEIGLWVGRAATPNHMGRKGAEPPGSARQKVRRFQAKPCYEPSPVPIEDCPWCGTKFKPGSFTLQPNDDTPTNLRVICANWECEFSGDRALPIVAVDEPLYRRLPCFLVATVDKFAALPWEARAGALLGGADRHDAEGFYGAAAPSRGRPLPSPLPPPDLIVQDELHLISGPLGSMAGLYETAVEALALRGSGSRGAKPKIVASTATTRRAQEQIRALFGRQMTRVFPPPGPSRRDSFFSQVVPASMKPARLYLGIASPGRNAKVQMRRVLLPLMAAAQQAFRNAGGHDNENNAADPYMTVLAYFNSLRELGGARRIVEEEVQNTLGRYGARRRLNQERRYFRDRGRLYEPLELTSRVSTAQVAAARRRLGQPFHATDRVDVALATNMISVGLDIQRLGLMVVMGQPKTTAEYIQATSRVGRADAKPGLVITLLNAHKPRDRSHYERFRHYHETFYRAVEAGSVTPFAARALDRGMAGTLVALARHAEPSLTPATAPPGLAEVRAQLEALLLDAFSERLSRQNMPEAEREEKLGSVRRRVGDLLDSWQYVVDDYRDTGTAVKYQQYEREQGKPLLREMLDTDFESPHHKKFRVNRSLRDVEPQVNLFITKPAGGGAD